MAPTELQPEALAQALAEHGDRFYALALRVTRRPDLAADAVQDAFLTALRRRGEFRGDAAVTTWLHRIVFNKSVDQLRARSREQPLPDEDGADWSPEDEGLANAPSWARPPDELLLGTETRVALEAALGELTPVQRAAFELREMEGRSTEEAAQILDVPPGTLRVHLHRARLRLRALLAPRFRREQA